MSDAVQMNTVRKTFGRKVAVEGIDLSIPEGSLYGFIGPNGAGKTTTIRMIMSILFPDSPSAPASLIETAIIYRQVYRRGDTARRLLEEAHARAEKLGKPTLAERARRELESTGP